MSFARTLMMLLPVLAVLGGCQPVNIVSAKGFYKSAISIAMVLSATDAEPDDDDGGEGEKVPRSECSECKGSGRVLAGDGVKIVWRECTNCYDDSSKTVEIPEIVGETPDTATQKENPLRVKKYFARIYSNASCVPCRRYRNSTIATLIRRGWKEGTHFEVITLSDYPFDLPRTEFFANGKVHSVKSGVLSIREFSEGYFWDRKSARDLRAWARNYRGPVAYVEGMSYQFHICDTNADAHSVHFELWQLEGLTTEELQKIHGAQHNRRISIYREEENDGN